MDFLELFGHLSSLQQTHPNLRWDVDDYDEMSVHFTLSPENAQLMRDARQMFS